MKPCLYLDVPEPGEKLSHIHSKKSIKVIRYRSLNRRLSSSRWWSKTFQNHYKRTKRTKTKTKVEPSTKLGDTKIQYIKMEGNIETGKSIEKDSR